NQRQQDPQHPLSKSSVGSGSHVMIARRGHAGYDRRENGIESLIDLRQAVRSANDCTVNTDGGERHTGRASNKVAEHKKVQPGNKGVNQLINADWRSVRDYRACYGEVRPSSRMRRNMSKQ